MAGVCPPDERSTRVTARYSASRMRQGFSAILSRVTRHGDHIVLNRRGKDVAVLIPVDDYAWFRALEDRLDLDAIRKSKAEPRSNVDWEDLKAELGL
jgi:prevent-host-death family protein